MITCIASNAQIIQFQPLFALCVTIELAPLPHALSPLLCLLVEHVQDYSECSKWFKKAEKEFTILNYA